MTGERLASSVASHNWVRLALGKLRGRKVSAAGMHPSGRSKIGLGFTWGWWVVGVLGPISKNHPSQHYYKSTKQFLLIAYLKITGLIGSNRTLCKLGTTSLSHFWRRKSDVKLAKREVARKRQNALTYLLQNAFESNQKWFPKNFLLSHLW